MSGTLGRHIESHGGKKYDEYALCCSFSSFFWLVNGFLHLSVLDCENGWAMCAVKSGMVGLQNEERTSGYAAFSSLYAPYTC